MDDKHITIMKANLERDLRHLEALWKEFCAHCSNLDCDANGCNREVCPLLKKMVNHGK
jgi:hypothetical protein